MKDQFGVFDQLSALQSDLGENPITRFRRSGRQNPAGPICYVADLAASITTAGPAINSLRCSYIYIAQTVLVQALLCEVTVVGAAGSAVRMGIYNNDPVTLLPTTLVADSGQIATDVGVGVKSGLLNGPVTLVGGSLYWLSMLIGTSAPTIRLFGTPNTPTLLGVSTTNMSSKNIGYIQAQAFGPLPNPFPLAGIAYLTDSISVALVGIQLA